MNIREFAKPVTAEQLNESLSQRFGARINLEQFTTEQLQDARNKIRTQMSQVETTESFDKVQTAAYQKNKLFLDVLNAEISERGSIAEDIDRAINQLNEGEEDKAEIVMAAKEMVDRITGWMEDTAEMQTQSMLELADAIRDELGSAMSEQFISTIKPALESLYQAMEGSRSSLTQGVTILTGESDGTEAMGAPVPGEEMTDMEPTVDGEEPVDDMGAEDEFGAAAPAAGGEEDAGRARRESIERPKKK